MGRLTKYLVPALLGLAAYFALFGGEYSVFEVRRARADRDAARDSLERLREENTALQARVDSLEADSATLERIAREQFGMIRDGEVLYRLVDSTDAEEDGGGGR